MRPISLSLGIEEARLLLQVIWGADLPDLTGPEIDALLAIEAQLVDLTKDHLPEIANGAPRP